MGSDGETVQCWTLIILKGYVMNTIKIIVDKNGFWHVYRTDKVTGQRAISFFQNVDEAKAALLK